MQIRFIYFPNINKQSTITKFEISNILTLDSIFFAKRFKSLKIGYLLAKIDYRNIKELDNKNYFLI